jgi:hypothetical protein
MKRILGMTGVMVLVAQAASAQVVVGARVGDAPTVGYDSAGRRDPFVTLVAPRRTSAVPSQTLMRPRTGLAALALADVSVTGLTKAGPKMFAILMGPDKQSFVLHVNDRLLDATVKAIDQQGVVFVQQMEGGKQQEIRKTLRAAAEVIR